MILQHAPTHYPLLHDPRMEPHKLIAHLVALSGGALRVCKAMNAESMQPTVSRFIAGQVKSPSRRTAEKLAAYFKIPVDALYDPRVAAQVFDRQFGQPTEAANLTREVIERASRGDPLSEALKTLASELTAADEPTRQAAGAMLLGMANAPMSAELLADQIKGLLRSGKRRAAGNT